MSFRLRMQWAEVSGQLNRWYCSQAQGRHVDDPELLWRHFVKSGGAADFALRFARAMSKENRWYCSEYYRRDVCDPETLWDYYLHYEEYRSDDGAMGNSNAA